MPPNILPWMPLHVVDWLSDRDVKKMHRVARSLYFDILCHEWLGGPFPDSVAEVAHMLSEDRRTIAAHWSSIRDRFDVDSSSNLFHFKLESLRSQALIKREKLSKAAKEQHSRSGKPVGDSENHPRQSIKESKSKNNKDTEETIGVSRRDGFDFASTYSRFPRKEGKAKGLAKLKASIKTQAEFDRFDRALNNYVTKIEVERIESKFVMQFSTFAGGRWEDYVEYTPSKSNGQQSFGYREPIPAQAENREEKL